MGSENNRPIYSLWKSSHKLCDLGHEYDVLTKSMENADFSVQELQEFILLCFALVMCAGF